jgi:hypothetical protein
MRARLVAGAVPGALLFAGFFIAACWPRPLLSDDLKFATGVVNWLQDHGMHVQSVHRWSHQPLNDGSCAATIRTNTGWVQVIVFGTENDLELIRVAEAPMRESGFDRYSFTVSGWPSDPSSGRGIPAIGGSSRSTTTGFSSPLI